MHNVTIAVKGMTLTLIVDLAKKGQASKSGKSMIIGSTNGYASVAGHPDVKVGLNVLGPKP